MGICGSAMGIEIARSRELEAQLASDSERERAAVKLLLLGAGESGKSTIFKQMRILYGRGFSEEERRAYTPVVHSNTLSAARTLLHNAQLLHATLGPAAREAASYIQHPPDAYGGVVFDATLARHIATLWDDPGIQHAYAQRSRFQLIDSAA